MKISKMYSPKTEEKNLFTNGKPITQSYVSPPKTSFIYRSMSTAQQQLQYTSTIGEKRKGVEERVTPEPYSVLGLSGEYKAPYQR